MPKTPKITPKNMSIFPNFLTSTNLEFISPPRHHPSKLTSLLTYPLLLQSLPLSTSPYAKSNIISLLFMPCPALSRFIPPCPTFCKTMQFFLQNYAILFASSMQFTLDALNGGTSAEGVCGVILEDKERKKSAQV